MPELRAVEVRLLLAATLLITTSVLGVDGHELYVGQPAERVPATSCTIVRCSCAPDR